jgi:PAS domain S-box-containing protein
MHGQELNHIEGALRVQVERQEAVADLARHAVSGSDPTSLIDEAVFCTCSLLGVSENKALELLLLAGGPSITADLRAQDRFATALISQDAPGPRLEDPSEIGSQMRRFTQEDVYTLQSMVSILVEAIRRKSAEEALKASRDQLDAILRGVEDAILVQTPEGLPVYVNDAAARMVGFPSADALMRKPPKEVLKRFVISDEEGRPVRFDDLPISEAFRGVRPHSKVLRIQVPTTREERWILNKASPIFSNKGEVTHAVTIATDITETMRNEQALRFLNEASRKLNGSLDFKTTLKSMAKLPVPYLADYCLVDILKDDWQMSRVFAYVSPGGAPKRKLKWYPSYQDPPPYILQTLRRGKPLMLNKTALPLKTDPRADVASLIGLDKHKLGQAMVLPLKTRGKTIGSVTLVSESKRHYTESDMALAEELVRSCAAAIETARLYQEAQDQRFAVQAVLDSITEGVLVLDSDLYILRANAFARRLLGDRKSSLEGQFFSNVLHLTDEAGSELYDLVLGVRKSVEQREISNYENIWLNARGDRRVPIALTVAPHIGGNGKTRTGACILLIRDMTEHREVNALRESIISLVSHELRTPLTHIKGFADSLLQTDVEWDEATKMDFIRSIDREADRLTKLVNDILEMSRVQSGKLPLKMTSAEPAEIVNAAIRQARPFLARHQVQTQFPKRAPLVAVDPMRIERVLVNLLENAAKYSDEGTTIKVQAARRGQEVVFSISDQGVGIPAASREAIFQRFVRLRNPATLSKPGTGLGLALCKAIVDFHGGRIWVESETGKGSTFFFTLPIASSDLANRTL